MGRMRLQAEGPEGGQQSEAGGGGNDPSPEPSREATPADTETLGSALQSRETTHFCCFITRHLCTEPVSGRSLGQPVRWGQRRAPRTTLSLLRR